MIPIERGKVMGAMTPERSLAVCCPRVAAMWHAAKNKGWTPLTISSASDLEVWWICAAGHEWSEQVRSRTAPRRWKGDDVAACGLCTGFHVLVACACGKQRLAKAAEAGVSYECVQCWSAKERERARWARRRARARTDFNPTLAECDELARSIAPTHLPPVLTTEWCRAVVPRLYEALLNERGYGKYNTLGAVEDTLRRLKEEGDLLPAIEQLRARTRLVSQSSSCAEGSGPKASCTCSALPTSSRRTISRLSRCTDGCAASWARCSSRPRATALRT
ncbi:zinc-ribbon domain-containing protein [Actinokineospora soli]|uniref:Zinc-ribbon domain-containing protein n=1 Tax=Actinokineospora soli TaxID=1048753 RepID=A0ABW2TKT0_9PSEU